MRMDNKMTVLSPPAVKNPTRLVGPVVVIEENETDIRCIYINN